MRKYDAALKKAAATAMNVDHGRQGRRLRGDFTRDGWDDFLKDGYSEDDAPQVVAAKALQQLCGGKYDRLVGKVVLLFLLQIFKGRGFVTEDCQSAVDLCHLIDSRATIDAYLEWANSNFH